MNDTVEEDRSINWLKRSKEVNMNIYSNSENN